MDVQTQADKVPARRWWALASVASAQFLAVASGSLYASSPTYGLLQPRAFMVTFGTSFN